jgi:hypothetical protein
MHLVADKECSRKLGARGKKEGDRLPIHGMIGFLGRRRANYYCEEGSIKLDL